ncbi:hypothetical protein [Pedobacter terrae]
MIFKFYGQNVPIIIRQLCQVTKSGVNMFGFIITGLFKPICPAIRLS